MADDSPQAQYVRDLRVLAIEQNALHDRMAAMIRFLDGQDRNWLPSTETDVLRPRGHVAQTTVDYSDATAFVANVRTNLVSFVAQESVTQKMLPRALTG